MKIGDNVRVVTPIPEIYHRSGSSDDKKYSWNELQSSMYETAVVTQVVDVGSEEYVHVQFHHVYDKYGKKVRLGNYSSRFFKKV